MWLTGFIDAEGTFEVMIQKSPKYRLGWSVEPAFKISLHQKDRALLESIQSFLGGRGSIYKEHKDSIQLRVMSLKDLAVIIDHLEKYPLITQKRADYLLWKSIVDLMNRKEHLTHDGLNKIVNHRASINNGLSDKLKAAFPDTKPVPRPLVVD